MRPEINDMKEKYLCSKYVFQTEFSFIQKRIKIEFFLKDSIVDIARFTGNNDFDYSVPSTQKALMFTRCQYALENMLDDFYKNYQSEINALHTRARVSRYASKKA